MPILGPKDHIQYNPMDNNSSTKITVQFHADDLISEMCNSDSRVMFYCSLIWLHSMHVGWSVKMTLIVLMIPVILGTRYKL